MKKLIFLCLAIFLSAKELDVKEVVVNKNSSDIPDGYFAKVILVKEKCDTDVKGEKIAKNVLLHDSRVKKQDFTKYYPEFLNYTSSKHGHIVSRVMGYKKYLLSGKRVRAFGLNKKNVLPNILRMRNLQLLADFNIVNHVSFKPSMSIAHMALKLFRYSYILNDKLHLDNKYVVSIGSSIPGSSYLLHALTPDGVVVLKKR